MCHYHSQPFGEIIHIVDMGATQEQLDGWTEMPRYQSHLIPTPCIAFLEGPSLDPHCLRLVCISPLSKTQLVNCHVRRPL